MTSKKGTGSFANDDTAGILYEQSYSVELNNVTSSKSDDGQSSGHGSHGVVTSCKRVDDEERVRHGTHAR